MDTRERIAFAFALPPEECADALSAIAEPRALVADFPAPRLDREQELKVLCALARRDYSGYRALVAALGRQRGVIGAKRLMPFPHYRPLDFNRGNDGSASASL
jgi:hypothetical protein